MPYVTEDYYWKFGGEPVYSADFPSLCRRAGEIIEEMTLYRVSEDRLEQFPEAIQKRIQDAVCAEIEYLDANGVSDLDNGADFQSAALGKFSYTRGAGASGGGGTAQSLYSPRACRILYPTGLLYRGGGSPCVPYPGDC